MKCALLRGETKHSIMDYQHEIDNVTYICHSNHKEIQKPRLINQNEMVLSDRGLKLAMSVSESILWWLIYLISCVDNQTFTVKQP